MRYVRYGLALLLVMGCAALVTLHLKREALARGIVNDILAGSGYSVSTLSIARLRPDEISLSRLVLEHDDGSRYDLRDLRVPLELPDTTIRQANIGRIAIQPAPATVDPPNNAELVALGLALPRRFPDVSVTVGELEWPGWPTAETVKWRTETLSQNLSLTAAGVELRISTEEMEDGRHRLAITADDGGEPLVAELAAEPEGPGYRLRGPMRAAPGRWLARARQARLLPAPEFAVEGSATANLDIALGTGPGGDLILGLVSTPDPGFHLTYDDSATGLHAVVTGLETLAFTYRHPQAEWTATAGAFGFAGVHPATGQIEGQVGDLRCTANRCEFTASSRVKDLRSADLRIGRIEAGGDATVSLGDAWTVSVSPTELRVHDLRGGNWSIGALELRRADGFVLDLRSGEAAARIAQATFEVEDMDVGADLAGNAQILLEDFRAAAPARLSTRFELPATGLHIAWRNEAVIPASLRGQLEYADERGDARLSIDDPGRGLEVGLAIGLRPDVTTIVVERASIDFAEAPLSRSFPAWPATWDIVAGTARARGTIAVRPNDTQGDISGDLHIDIDNAAAAWDELGATGIKASIPVRLAPGGETVIGPVSAGAALVDVGLPLSDFAAQFTWHTAEPGIEVASLAASLLGGRIQAAPFRLEPDPLRADLRLSVESIQPGLIPELAEFESVEVTGMLSGTIPVRIDGETITVDAGRLDSEAPGGVIRYRSDLSPNAGSGLALAQRALSNLQYESLAAEVSYTESGDLILKMRLEGTNPDLDPLQPVILNLTVENNIPELLKSLQASRDIQDIIERRSQRAPPELPQ